MFKVNLYVNGIATLRGLEAVDFRLRLGLDRENKNNETLTLVSFLNGPVSITVTTEFARKFFSYNTEHLDITLTLDDFQPGMVKDHAGYVVLDNKFVYDESLLAQFVYVNQVRSLNR